MIDVSKYGKGLGREIYIAAQSGEIKQPFNVADCRKYAKRREWDVRESYLRVVLANSEVNRDHSETYKNYFIRVSRGLYKINPNTEIIYPRACGCVAFMRLRRRQRFLTRVVAPPQCLEVPHALIFR